MMEVVEQAGSLFYSFNNDSKSKSVASWQLATLFLTRCQYLPRLGNFTHWLANFSLVE